jgi:hypothetical protein
MRKDCVVRVVVSFVGRAVLGLHGHRPAGLIHVLYRYHFGGDHHQVTCGLRKPMAAHEERSFHMNLPEWVA